MGGSPTLRIKKYFGTDVVQEMVFSLEDAREYLSYFWTKEGSSNVKIAKDGKSINSYEDLVDIVKESGVKKNNFVEIGLFLSNDGKKSIWPDR